MSTKGKWLTIEQKCDVIAQHRREPAASYTQLAQWAKTRFELSVPPSRQTVRNIVKAADDIEARRERGNLSGKGRSPCVRSQELEDQLKQYAQDCEARDVRLTRRLLNNRAREILDGMESAPTLNLSVGWLTRFMKRHGLRFQKEREGPTEFEAVGDNSVLTTPVDVQVEQQVPVAVRAQTVTDEESARVNELRQKWTVRLREIEKEAREIRKYLRRLEQQEASDIRTYLGRLDAVSAVEQQEREAGNELVPRDGDV
ncbi:hypothetical protein P3T76_012947 [Phytophthora citrophthora]|uniref:HTH CENPB-type domain-containing protein n=1 Tax=Phytophthora citrophthora TaxID=4793 RepID=A0AAD9G4Y9_9STRA|nr:hypothetical protein P3T76_012947 [Phytophthora citrophthora]